MESQCYGSFLLTAGNHTWVENDVAGERPLLQNPLQLHADGSLSSTNSADGHSVLPMRVRGAVPVRCTYKGPRSH